MSHSTLHTHASDAFKILLMKTETTILSSVRESAGADAAFLPVVKQHTSLQNAELHCLLVLTHY